MKLREARKMGIKYCRENKVDYIYISYNITDEFYWTNKEDNHTVFLVGKNGSLKRYLATQYAADFHKELKKRKSLKRKQSLKKETITAI